MNQKYEIPNNGLQAQAQPQAQAQAQLYGLFEHDYDKLYSAAFRMTGNHHDAEDVLQNAFVKALEGVSGFRGEAQLATWLYRILMNECANYYRQLKKLPVTLITEKLGVSEEQFFEGLEANNPPIDDQLLVEEMREKCLNAFMRCLPKHQRAVFVLRTFIQLPLSEIAEVLQITENNAKVTLHRARKSIQELHKNRCSLIDPSKPCKCYLWILYMKEQKLALPRGYADFKDCKAENEALVDAYKHYVQGVVDVYQLYKVGRKLPKADFLHKLREHLL